MCLHPDFEEHCFRVQQWSRKSIWAAICHSALILSLTQSSPWPAKRWKHTLSYLIQRWKWILVSTAEALQLQADFTLHNITASPTTHAAATGRGESGDGESLVSSQCFSLTKRFHLIRILLFIIMKVSGMFLTECFYSVPVDFVYISSEHHNQS